MTTPSTTTVSDHLAGLQYPLTLSFKIVAISSKITVTDANGKTVLFTKQKKFRFREHVELFTDSTQTTLLAEIKTRKILDWSARYQSTDAQGQELGSVGRRGWKSIFKAHYEVFNPGDDQTDISIQEENPVAKFFDSILDGVPVLGFLSGYFFHPKYLACRTSSGEALMRLEKLPAFWEGKFKIEKLGGSDPREELNLILSFLMLILLERKRG